MLDSACMSRGPAKTVDTLLPSLLRGDGKELDAYLATLKRGIVVANTKTVVHVHALLLNNRKPRADALARAIVARIVDYVIPRSEFEAARDYDAKYNTSARVTELRAKAKNLFADVPRSGEGGELLLYMLIQTYLRMPQLFCKMPLKTNPRLHINGTDGVHVGLDNDGTLGLYWGESKLYSDAGAAITSCLDSIMPFVCPTGATRDASDRDIELIRSGIDLNEPKLQNAILRYLDKDDRLYNKLSLRGACLIGFDHACYTKATDTEIAKEIQGEIAKWTGSLSKQLLSRDPLHDVEMHAFILPFPSVDDFRNAFQKELKNA